jgi:hypothetical protein
MAQLAAEGHLGLERLQYPDMLVQADVVVQLVMRHDQQALEQC